VQRAKNLIPILVPLFVSAFRRADELAIAMEARCYRGGHDRTRLNELKYNKRDVYAYFVILGMMVAIFATRWL
jgi:energy-coupling factor transport system permease protein